VENGNRGELHGQNQLNLLEKYYSRWRVFENIAESRLPTESGNQRRSNISETIQGSHRILVFVIMTINEDVKSMFLNTLIQRVDSNVNNDVQKKSCINLSIGNNKRSNEIFRNISMNSIPKSIRSDYSINTSQKITGKDFIRLLLDV